MGQQFDFTLELRDAQPGMVCRSDTKTGLFSVSVAFAEEIIARWNRYARDNGDCNG